MDKSHEEPEEPTPEDQTKDVHNYKENLQYSPVREMYNITRIVFRLFIPKNRNSIKLLVCFTSFDLEAVFTVLC